MASACTWLWLRLCQVLPLSRLRHLHLAIGCRRVEWCPSPVSQALWAGTAPRRELNPSPMPTSSYGAWGAKLGDVNCCHDNSAGSGGKLCLTWARTRLWAKGMVKVGVHLPLWCHPSGACRGELCPDLRGLTLWRGVRVSTFLPRYTMALLPPGTGHPVPPAQLIFRSHHPPFPDFFFF